MFYLKQILKLNVYQTKMPLYKNSSGSSGVTAYTIGKALIKVVFKDGQTYVYSYKSAGKKHIEEMKKLATIGKGLTTYINVHVKEKYDKKL